ncbi:unnamed protein product [Microthlaspi erraticum]|uniref:Retrotransposon gag domain-containing protein n=1 Tax=Microthlaspi erraticum TaxID=1685480 RepID=A0A6D2HK34_9BRAS|nr:unnamed protein product [Microthlaspi erraticum]
MGRHTTHPEVLNEELIKHVERNPFYNSTSECAKEHLCNFEQLCHDYGLGDNPKKIQLFQLSLAGQAKDWAKFNAQHAFKTWNGYKGAFLTDLPKVLFMSHHHAQAIHNTIHHHQT